MILTHEEIERRTPVWTALADLFVDTELQPYDYDYIARVIREAGYSAAQARDILENEVFPFFSSNLLSIAGNWTGWMPEVVREEVLCYLAKPRLFRAMRRISRFWLRRSIMKTEWPRLEKRLSH